MMIEVKNLSVAYGSNEVITKASFAVERGDFVCIVGANGSGKSTLVKTLLGLLSPVSGTIKFAGDGRPLIGYLPQEAHLDQNFPATLGEIVLSGCLGQLGRRIFYRPRDKKRAQEILAELGLGKFSRRRFAALSGGQKQKVLLARALMATDDLLILDEPLNNLDHASRSEFYQILKKLNASGLTILMITHDLDADDLIGNKVLALKDAHVQASSTREFLEAFR